MRRREGGQESPTMETTAEAVVIGGGIMGASAAHFLARKGIGRVILLEKRTFAAVSTGHSAANIRCSYSNPVTIQLALRAMDIFENDEEIIGGATGFRRTGQLILFGASHLDVGRQVLASESAQNTGTKEITTAEIQSLAPQLNLDGVVSATYQPRAGYADPVMTTRTLIEQASRHGLTAYESIGATRIDTDGRCVTGVATADGTIHTPCVVNAAGPWGPHIGGAVGHLCNIRWSRECDLVMKLPDGFGTFPIVADPICHIYFRPQHEGRMLAGLDYPKELEPLDIDDYDADLDADSRRRIETGLFTRIPALRDAVFDRGWASIYTITDDWHPFAGAVPGVEGYFACFGGSGHGFKLGPPIGEALADVIMGATPKIDIRPLRPTRLEEGEPFSSAWGAGNRA